jgi:hypothetical protein
VKRYNKYKLYFVETPSAEENCFVPATLGVSAAKFERDESGFNGKACKATFVRDLTPEWVKDYLGREEQGEEHSGTSCFYVMENDLLSLGVSWRIIEGDDHFYYKDKEFIRQVVFNYIADIKEDGK